MALTMTHLRAQAGTLGDVMFQSTKPFHVPRYQRPYAWSAEEAGELWEDIVETSQRPPFIGSLIFNTEYAESGYLEIIDGQQRLLTITILCAVLRDVARDLDPAQARLIQVHDIAHQDYRGRQTYRIKPGDSCSQYFEQFVQDE